jgi:choline/glycine/proline betaine transport protein
MRFPDYRYMERYLEEHARPAMQEVQKSLMEQGLAVDFTETKEGGDKHLSLHVHLADEQDFIYQIWPVRFKKPTFAPRVQRAEDFYYRLEVYLNEGSQGYDLMDYSKEQVIGDILDQYESHLNFLHLNQIALSGVNPPATSEQSQSG